MPQNKKIQFNYFTADMLGEADDYFDLEIHPDDFGSKPDFDPDDLEII